MKTVKITASIIVAIALSLSACGGSKQTAEQAKAQAEVNRGFQTVETPVTELDAIKKDMENKMIPCGIGSGESTDEMTARNIAADEARADIARTMSTLVQSLSENYVQNVSAEAKKIWEQGVRQLTDQELHGATSYKTVTQFNPENGHYKIYSLYVMNPELFKKAAMEAAANQEELELRVKKDDMMKKMDEGIAAYQEKYKK